MTYIVLCLAHIRANIHQFAFWVFTPTFGEECCFQHQGHTISSKYTLLRIWTLPTPTRLSCAQIITNHSWRRAMNDRAVYNLCCSCWRNPRDSSTCLHLRNYISMQHWRVSAQLLKIQNFWDVSPRRLVSSYWRLEYSYSLHLQYEDEGTKILWIVLKNWAVYMAQHPRSYNFSGPSEGFQ